MAGSMFNFDDIQVEERSSYKDWVSHRHIDINLNAANQPTNIGNLPAINTTNGNDAVTAARLFLFSPKKTYPYMVRPHVYDFKNSPQHVLQQMADNFKNELPIVTQANINMKPEFLATIKPAKAGHIVNLDPISDLWTFVLIVDTEGPRSSHMMPSIYRHVSSGVCLNEPINVSTGSHNPNATFKFTHHTGYQYRANRLGVAATPLPFVNHDIIPSEFIKGVVSNNELFAKLDPNSMRATHPFDHMMNEIGSQSGMTVSAPTLNLGTNPRIDAGIKLGSAHLKTITNYLHAARAQTEERGRRDRYGTMSPAIGTNLTSAFYNLLSSETGTPTTGLSTHEYLSFAKIDYMFPNIEIIPVQTHRNPRSWEVYNSQIINPLNTYNAWVADTLAFLCETSGVVKFAFTYDSCCGNRWEKEGRWYVYPEQFETIHGYDHQKSIATFTSIQQKLEYDLFSILRMANGEFQLTANYRLNAETLVDLKFHDETNVGALFEHPTHLGGWVNPNVGDINTYQDNAENLQGLVNMMSTI